MNDPANQLTHDAFLGGRLRVWQPKSGFRAGVDAVLLAAAVPIRGGQSALELGPGWRWLRCVWRSGSPVFRWSQ